MADLCVTRVAPWQAYPFYGFLVDVTGDVHAGLRISLHDCVVADDAEMERATVRYLIVSFVPLTADQVTGQLLVGIATAMERRHARPWEARHG